MAFKIKSTQTGPPLTIIGKDLEAGSTFNADLAPTTGKQRAGRFMSYDPANMVLTPWDGVADAPGATIFGILADDCDTREDSQTEVESAAMVYRDGTFLRQEIESANNAAIEPGGPLDNALRLLGIYLELSYEGYVGIDPVPAGVVPMGLTEDTKVGKPGPGPGPERPDLGPEPKRP